MEVERQHFAFWVPGLGDPTQGGSPAIEAMGRSPTEVSFIHSFIRSLIPQIYIAYLLCAKAPRWGDWWGLSQASPAEDSMQDPRAREECGFCPQRNRSGLGKKGGPGQVGFPRLWAPWCLGQGDRPGFKACWSPRAQPVGEAWIWSRRGRVWWAQCVVSGVRETWFKF